MRSTVADSCVTFLAGNAGGFGLHCVFGMHMDNCVVIRYTNIHKVYSVYTQRVDYRAPLWSEVISIRNGGGINY